MMRPLTDELAEALARATHLPAERAVLAIAIAMPDSVGEQVDLEEREFSVPRHRAIWRAVLNARAEGSPMDAVALSGAIADACGVDRPTAVSWLVELSGSIATGAMFPHYMRLVREAQQERERLIADGAGSLSPVGLGEADIARMRQASATGLYAQARVIDRGLGGLRPKESTLLIADTGRGKTTFAVCLMDDLARQGHRIIYVASEPTGEQILAMLVQRHAESFLNDRRLDAEALSTAVEEVRALSLTILLANQERAKAPERWPALVDRVASRIGDFGAVVVIWDNLHHALGDDPDFKAVGAAVRRLVGLGETTGAHQFVLAHVNKAMGQRGKGLYPTDFKGPHSASEQVYNMIGLEIVKGDRGYETIFHAWKRRTNGPWDHLPAAYRFIFDSAKLRYDPVME